MCFQHEQSLLLMRFVFCTWSLYTLTPRSINLKHPSDYSTFLLINLKQFFLIYIIKCRPLRYSCSYWVFLSYCILPLVTSMKYLFFFFWLILNFLHLSLYFLYAISLIWNSLMPHPSYNNNAINQIWENGNGIVMRWVFGVNIHILNPYPTLSPSECDWIRMQGL